MLDNQSGGSAGPFNPTMAMVWFPSSTIEQEPTVVDGVPAIQTSVQTPGLAETVVTEPLIGSATLTTTLPGKSTGPGLTTAGFDGMPAGSGILASGPYEENLAWQGPPLNSTGALVTGGTLVGAGAAFSTLTITETGLLITGGTLATVVSWPLVLASIAGVGVVAGTVWLFSQDPPEGEERSKGAQPGSVPKPPPAPTPPKPVPELYFPPVIPETPTLPALPDEPIPEPVFPSTELPAIPGRVADPTASTTPWEPHAPPALDPFDVGSDGVDDPTALPDPTQISPVPPQREPVGPVTQTPPYAADQTGASAEANNPTAADAGNSVSDTGGSSGEEPVTRSDAEPFEGSEAAEREILVETLVKFSGDSTPPAPRVDLTPYMRAALALATDEELLAVQTLIGQWGEDAQLLLAQYGLKGVKKTEGYIGTENVADRLYESLNNLDEVRYRGYPYLFESREQYEALKVDVLELARRYGVDPNDVIFRVQGGSVHNPDTGDVDIALVVDSETFERYATQFLDNSDILRIQKAIKKDAAKGKFAYYRWAPREPLARPVGVILHDTLPGADKKIQLSMVEEGGPFDFGPYL
ncbi:hypothetical protein ACFO5K_08170 [Nocardia halotolerans]|uniref:Uncharacterized protein n=1 Tax=Nocardia halotolerans TaxID=1755878 RepID=A0ABV8VGA0_9NOCA